MRDCVEHSYLSRVLQLHLVAVAVCLVARAAHLVAMAAHGCSSDLHLLPGAVATKGRGGSTLEQTAVMENCQRQKQSVIGQTLDVLSIQYSNIVSI